MKYLLLGVAILLLSCENDKLGPVEPLEGKWVEASNRADTLVFDPELNGNNSTYFTLKSKNGISGYNNLYSTIYEYHLENGKISLYNLVSSCYCFTDYSFTQTADKIFVENFYDSNSKGVIEVFEKIK